MKSCSKTFEMQSNISDTVKVKSEKDA